MSKQKMMDLYNNSLKQFGEFDFRSLTWGDSEGTSANKRYEDMNLQIPFNDKQLIEFGCGWGSFFDFGFSSKSYYGIDINENFVNIANKKYSNKQFECCDILGFLPTKKYDLAISSGVAGNQGGPADHPIKLKKFLETMYLSANSVMVNFPSIWATIRSENIEYFSPSSTFEIALSITPNVTLIHKEKSDFLLILK